MLITKKKPLYDRTSQGINPYIMMFPSLCDVLATILDTTGLIMTSVSV